MVKRRRRTIKPLAAVWAGYTRDEMAAMSLMHAAFGTVTHITREQFDLDWVRPHGASWDKCPQCMTLFTHEHWPQCQWCGFRDRGRFADYG